MGSVVYIMKMDVRTGTATLRRNMKHIRSWLEEQGSAASRSTLCASRPVLAEALSAISIKETCGACSAAKQDIKQVAEHPPEKPKEPKV